MLIGLTGQHTSKFHAVKDETGRTYCGRHAWSVAEGGEYAAVDCKTCLRLTPDQDYTVEITECVVSAEAEECQFGGDHEDGCDGECFSLDGDVRYVEEPLTTLHSFEHEDGDTPDEWAVQLIEGEVSSRSSDFLEASMWPLPSRVFEHAWLTGQYTSPVTGYETQYSVRLTGSWTPEQRSRVFRSATNMLKV